MHNIFIVCFHFIFAFVASKIGFYIYFIFTTEQYQHKRELFGDDAVYSLRKLRVDMSKWAGDAWERCTWDILIKQKYFFAIYVLNPIDGSNDHKNREKIILKAKEREDERFREEKRLLSKIDTIIENEVKKDEFDEEDGINNNNNNNFDSNGLLMLSQDVSNDSFLLDDISMSDVNSFNGFNGISGVGGISGITGSRGSSVRRQRSHLARLNVQYNHNYNNNNNNSNYSNYSNYSNININSNNNTRYVTSMINDNDIKDEEKDSNSLILRSIHTPSPVRPESRNISLKEGNRISPVGGIGGGVSPFAKYSPGFGRCKKNTMKRKYGYSPSPRSRVWKKKKRFAMFIHLLILGEGHLTLG